MRHSFFIAFLSFCFAAFALVNMSARAQTLDASLLDNDFGVDFLESFDQIDNPYLADSIKLHYQITLLEKMTARQAELVKIKTSFDALGIPFEEPPPSYTLCTQLPPNTPCLRHYPQLYSDLIQSRERHYADMIAQQAAETGLAFSENMNASQLAAIDPALLERSRKEQEARKKREEEARLARLAEERRNRYQWSEISCVGGKCSGVVSGANGFRATVRDGSRLPDNTLISDISRTGIDVVIDGERIALRPLPADGAYQPVNAMALNIAERIQADIDVNVTDSADEYVPPEGLSSRTTSILNNAGTRGADDLDPVTPQAVNRQGGGNMAATNNDGNAGDGVTAGGAAGGGATVVEPALGPSGLF